MDIRKMVNDRINNPVQITDYESRKLLTLLEE